jgi:hypothetical protein
MPNHLEPLLLDVSRVPDLFLDVTASPPQRSYTVHHKTSQFIPDTENGVSNNDNDLIMTSIWSPKHQAEFFTFGDGLPPQILPGELLQTPSPNTKDAIFRTYLPYQNEEAEKGRTLLTKLRRLAPNVADKFEVRDDLVGDFTLRLINQSNIDVQGDDDTRSYIAFSYCWDARFEDKRVGEYGEEFTVPFDTLILRKSKFSVST